MSKSIDIVSDINSIKESRAIGIIPFLLILIPVIILMLVFFYIRQEYILFGIVIAIPFILLLFRYPKLWLYTVALSSIYFFRDTAEGVTLMDSFSAVFLIGGLFAWFFASIFINKEKVVKNQLDWLFLAFFAILPLNLLIALLNGVDIIDWARVYGFFTLTLYYFPIRKYFYEKADLIKLLTAYLITALASDFIQFYDYYLNSFAYVVYAWQYATSVRSSQSFFVAVSVFTFLFGIIEKNTLKKYFLLISSMLTIGALITTFSRAYWLMLIINIAISILYLPLKYKKRIISYSLLIIFLFSLILVLVLQDKTAFVINAVEKRFVSTSEGTKDISLQMRLNEYKGVWDEVKRYPVGGSGFAKTFQYYDPILIRTVRTDFIHNGYYALIYKLGLPLTIFYIAVLVGYLLIGERLIRKSYTMFDKAVLISASTSLLMMIATNFITTTIDSRDGSFVIAVSIGIISIYQNKRFSIDNTKQFK